MSAWPSKHLFWYSHVRGRFNVDRVCSVFSDEAVSGAFWSTAEGKRAAVLLYCSLIICYVQLLLLSIISSPQERKEFEQKFSKEQGAMREQLQVNRCYSVLKSCLICWWITLGWACWNSQRLNIWPYFLQTGLIYLVLLLVVWHKYNLDCSLCDHIYLTPIFTYKHHKLSILMG